MKENDFYIPCSRRASNRASQASTSRASSVVPSTQVSTPAASQKDRASPSAAISEAIAALSPSKNSPERIASVTKQQKASGSPQKSAHHSFRRLSRKGLHASKQLPMASFQKVPWKFWPPQQVKDFFLWPDAEFGSLVAERQRQIEKEEGIPPSKKRGRPIKNSEENAADDDEEEEEESEEEVDSDDDDEEEDEESGGPPEAIDAMRKERRDRKKEKSSNRSTRVSSRRSSPPPIISTRDTSHDGDATPHSAASSTGGHTARPRKQAGTISFFSIHLFCSHASRRPGSQSL